LELIGIFRGVQTPFTHISKSKGISMSKPIYYCFKGLII
jgi:hypothetical protein